MEAFLLPLVVGKDGFEPPKVKPADLQSAPFGHSGTCPIILPSRRQKSEPMGGFEPSTPRLQITCSGQLSYIGNKSISIPHKPKGIAKIANFSELQKSFAKNHNNSITARRIPSSSRPQLCRCSLCGAWTMNSSGTPIPLILVLMSFVAKYSHTAP